MSHKFLIASEAWKTSIRKLNTDFEKKQMQ